MSESVNDRPDIHVSRNGTLHLSAEEIGFTEHGERKKMQCGALLPGTGHAYDEFAVEDFQREGDLCERCFPERSGIENTGKDRSAATGGDHE